LWEVSWALNTLAVYTYTEELRLADVDGLCDALLRLWRVCAQ
jgi:hypothetical protein